MKKLNYEKVTINIRQELKKYILDNNIRALIIGVSGGIDSALCCALAKPVCDDLQIPLIGQSLPIETNKSSEIIRAHKIGECFCHRFATVDLSTEYQLLYNKNSSMVQDVYKNLQSLPEHTRNVICGNRKARMRMMKLYEIASINSGMVLSTDNYTEYMLGFSTIMGDWGDYGMIQYLWKTEVYELSQFLWENDLPNNEKAQNALQECIDAVPTDGLGISNSDLDQLGAPNYEEVDRILKTWLTNSENYYDEILFLEEKLYFNEEKFMGWRADFTNHPVIVRHNRSHFKRNWPITISREALAN